MSLLEEVLIYAFGGLFALALVASVVGGIEMALRGELMTWWKHWRK